MITVDDDIIYHRRMIEKLYRSHLIYPDCICAMRCHEITYDLSGKPEPYSNWIKNTRVYNAKKKNLFFTSGAGTLFPAKCYKDMLFDLETIRKLCYKADDVWLNAMARYSATEILNVPINENERTIISVFGTQKTALKYENLYGQGNDICVNNLVNRFGVGIL